MHLSDAVKALVSQALRLCSGLLEPQRMTDSESIWPAPRWSINLPAPKVPERGQYVSSTEWMQSAWWCSLSWGEGGGIFGADVHDSLNTVVLCNISPFFICHKIRQCQRFQRHFRNMSSIRVNLRQHGPFGSNLGPTWVQQRTAWTQVGTDAGNFGPTSASEKCWYFTHVFWLDGGSYLAIQLGHTSSCIYIQYYTILVKN
jgi:hypothetical protein